MSLSSSQAVAVEEVIASQRDAILERWLERVRRALMPDALPRTELLDHIPMFLDSLILAMRLAHSPALESAEHWAAQAAMRHGEYRLREGFSLDAVVHEYGLLRDCLLTLVREQGLEFPPDQMQAFTECFHRGIAEAAIVYLHQHERELRAAGAAAERKHAHALLDAILERTTDLVAALDPEFHFILFNRRYQQEFEANFGTRLSLGLSLLEALAHLPEQRNRLILLWGRALRGEEFTVVQPFGTPAHEQTWYELRYARLADENGALRGAFHVGRDVTAARKAHEELERRVQERTAALAQVNARLLESAARLESLAQLSQALSASRLELPRMLSALARVVAERLNGGCVVQFREPGLEAPAQVAFHHVHPEALEGLIQLLDLKREGTEPPGLMAPSSGSVFLSQAAPEALRAAVAPDFWPTLERFHAHSLVFVPLSVGGQKVGSLGLWRDTTPQPLSPEDQALVEAMAERAALAFENVLLYRAAQRAVHLRDEFLQVASHEMKTPLTPLSLKLQMLSRMAGAEPSTLSARRLQQDVEMMHRQVNRLAELIDDLLDVSRITAGQLYLKPERMDLCRLTREVSARFTPQAARAGCRLQLDLECEALGQWDPLRLEQVVSNLLSNAIKYGAGHPIHLRAETVGTHARLTVRDEGIGIAPEALGRIFHKFERAVSGRNYGGLGLGLFITRQIVEACGGTLQVESQLGQGATFTVELPLARPVGTGEQPAE